VTLLQELAKEFEGYRRRTNYNEAAALMVHLLGPKEQAALNDLRATIMGSITLAFPDPDKRICLLTNASYRLYDGLVAQIHEEQLDFPMEEQDHQPLVFFQAK
jgi:hypothetical protein